MIYQYTGQPGHGKTLTALARALEFKAAGRVVYACNVRELDYEKTGFLPMTPEQFCDWMNFLPDGAVALVDEAYEKGMLPKRSPAQRVPEHVERLATHRHRGIDFIFVCQSPDKQMDGFVHDLIERHIHVRRRFGTQFQNLREFDRFERNPEKSTPLVIKRQRLPKHVFGLYKSTELDTTERRIPWYFFAFAIGAPAALAFMYWTFGGMKERLGGGPVPTANAATLQDANGAQAPVASSADKASMTTVDYIRQFTPRVPSQPWSAPAYDDKAVSSDPPRVFCMSSAPGEDIGGEVKDASCTCLTEQGTSYKMPFVLCQAVARQGQYEPYFSERNTDGLGGEELYETNAQALDQRAAAKASMTAPQVSEYGDLEAGS